MEAIDIDTAYYATAVIYTCKMFYNVGRQELPLQPAYSVSDISHQGPMIQNFFCL